MLNFNFLGALSSLLPGYLEGRRQAIKDNWQDLSNYNNVQQGQLSNAFTVATWQPRLDMFADAAYNSGFNTLNNAMNTAVRGSYFPGQVMHGNMFSHFSPQLSYLDNLSMLLAHLGAIKNGVPGTMAGGGVNPAPTAAANGG